MNFRILLIDDDNLVCVSLKKVLVKFGYDVEICMKGDEAFDKIREFDPDIILLDIYLTTHNGLELLKSFTKAYPHIAVIMITGYSDVKMAVTAIKSGAFDFLLKPIDLDQLKLVLSKASDKIALKSEVDKLHILMQGTELTREFFGKSKKIQRVLNSVEKLARSSDTTILIEGESGTGKEGLAKFIHQNSSRRDSPFIEINCAAIPKELAESELFGHEKGAFTGAAPKTKLGKFELAEGGTILLDEIAELSVDLQVKLLRVLQEKRFYRIGGEKEVSINVRVLAATNKNLEEEVQKGNFREDLYYRLNVFSIFLPPLRDRKTDILLLADHFMLKYGRQHGKSIRRISTPAIDMVMRYHWPGNVRELENCIERAVLVCEDQVIHSYHLPPTLQTAESSDTLSQLSLKNAVESYERELIQDALKSTRGNIAKASRLLDTTERILGYKINSYQIDAKRFKI